MRAPRARTCVTDIDHPAVVALHHRARPAITSLNEALVAAREARGDEVVADGDFGLARLELGVAELALARGLEVPAQVGVVVGAVIVRIVAAAQEGGAGNAAFLQEIYKARAGVGTVFLLTDLHAPLHALERRRSGIHPLVVV